MSSRLGSAATASFHIVRPVIVVVTVDEGEDLGAVMGATVVVTGSILANSKSSLM